MLLGRSLWYGCLLVLLLLFPYGPLFPWSPLRPGFERRALGRADVYYPTGGTLDPGFDRIDDYLRQSEAFHRLTAPKRLTVVLCRDWNDFWIRLPQFRGSRGIGAVTLATGTVIYVSPRLRERGLDSAEFLRHEISHATIHQNQSVFDAFRFSELQWLSEGLAVSFGDQKAYYTDTEYRDRIRREDVTPFLDPARRNELQGPFEIRYAYVVWRRFNEFQMSRRGRDKYQQFLEATMHHPGEWRALFEHYLGISFDQAIVEFQAAARN